MFSIIGLKMTPRPPTSPMELIQPLIINIRGITKTTAKAFNPSVGIYNKASRKCDLDP